VRIGIIGNPISGRGRTLGRITELARWLRRSGHKVDEYLTEAAGDAGRFASQCADQVDRLIVAGGDGTLNEVLNGLPTPGMVPLGLLPSGTANLLARELHLPFDPAGVAKLVGQTEPKIMHLDLCHARIGTMDCPECDAPSHRFLLVASVGFDAMVMRQIDQTRRGKLGFWGYPGPIVKVAMGYRQPRLRVCVSDDTDHSTETHRAAMVVVGNIKTYAGFFTITEQADCTSGRLDVCLFKQAGVDDLIPSALAALRGRLSQQPGIVNLAGKRVTINTDENDEPIPIEIDGEYVGETPISISIEAGVVPFLVG